MMLVCPVSFENSSSSMNFISRRSNSPQICSTSLMGNKKASNAIELLDDPNLMDEKFYILLITTVVSPGAYYIKRGIRFSLLLAAVFGF